MQGPILRKYGASATINFELFEVDGVDFRVDAVHAAGDTAIMKDEGAEANTTNSFTDEGSGYSLVLTATEMQAARIVIYAVDQTATKVWLDKSITIETYGNASAQHAVDLDDSVRAGLTALPNAAADAAGGLPISDAGGLDMDDIPLTAEFEARTLVAASYFDPATDTVANVTTVATTTANTDMRGTDSALLAASAPSNWSALGISVGGAISDVVLCATTTANTDMRGTDSALLAASSPTNWSALGISVGGAIDDVTLCATTTTNTDMRGTDSAATAASLATAQADLDIITGADGANLLSGTQASIDAIEVDTSSTLPGLIDDLAVKKNATFSNFEFLMVLASDHATPATGLTVTGQRSVDGAAFTAVAGAIAEVSNGIYQFDALAADTNGDVITWRFSSATADDTFVTFKTVA